MGTMQAVSRKLFQKSWFEAGLMIAVFLVSFLALFIIAFRADTPPGAMSTLHIVSYLLGFFVLSVSIALVSVIAGIGGGVLFTPIMLAFTPVDSLIIRATGLIVAMFSGLIATGTFLRNGLGNFRLSLLLVTSQGIGALIGAKGAIFIYEYLGVQGEAFIRLVLGLMIALIAVYFLVGGQKLEWPKVNRVDRFTAALNLGQSYFERSENRHVEYKLTRAWLGLILTFVVGLVGGFFGMGAGWAITPVQNLALGAPLKVAAANSSIILGMVDCVAVWPYIHIGAIIPLFVLPWLSGQVLGGYIGSLLLVKIKVNVVRQILIGIMFFTAYGLLTKGLELLAIIEATPPIVSISVFGLIFIVILVVIIRTQQLSQGRTAR